MMLAGSGESVLCDTIGRHLCIILKVQGIGQKLSNTDVGGSKKCGRKAPTE